MADLTTCTFAGFGLLLLVLSGIDWHRGILPDVLTLPGAALALAVTYWTGWTGLSFEESLAGALIGSGVFWLVAWRFPQALGLGDAKLMLLIGALCGVRGLPLVLTVATATGLAHALVTGKKTVPFGPFLSLGAFLHMLGVRP